MRTETSKRNVGVKVRMYCHGLGDCFLLTFTEGDNKRYVMIDCGVAMGTEDAPQLMASVVEDIKSETGGEVDVLAVTHEHWDHISGFADAQAAIEGSGPGQGLQAGQVWLSWAENPKSTIARRLKDRWGPKAAALQLLAKRLSASEMRLREAVAGAMAAYGDLLAAGTSKAEAMNYVRKHFGKPEYLRPGQVLTLPGISGVRVYVLGPPREEEWIGCLERKGETYKPALSLDSAFLSGALWMVGLDEGENQALWEETRDLTFPFTRFHRIPAPPRDEPQRPAGDTEGDPARSFFAARYRAPERDWRTIDNDWLDVAGELALDLVKKTNNTSLVLAFELVETGEVLLFPGDAQVGNWLSWADRTLGARLLEKTVLYKVGHHGSHNATLKAKGLERMTDEDLVAMIPVDSAQAKKMRYGVMPFGKLLEELRESAHGRVLESDEDLDLSGWTRPDDLIEADWKSFQGAVALHDTEPRYVEYTLP